MSQEHHHHLFHRHKDEDNVDSEGGYNTGGDAYNKPSDDGYGGAYGSSDYNTGSGYNDTGSGYNDTGSGYGYGEKVTETTVYATEDSSQDDYEKAMKEEKHHKRMEHVGELGTMAAGAYAMYEKHEAKKDPEHAHRHKIEEEVAAAAAVGAGGYAFHEHHEKKEDKEEAEEASGKKHHHHLF
eukprot:Gb_18966 [translate_table: standard]